MDLLRIDFGCLVKQFIIRVRINFVSGLTIVFKNLLLTFLDSFIFLIKYENFVALRVITCLDYQQVVKLPIYVSMADLLNELPVESIPV